MGSVEGPFKQVSFCGASVMSFTSSVGWNEQSSTVTVMLVEDPDKGDKFTKPPCGTPQVFDFEGFHFEGLVQRWLEKDEISGKPTYEITMTDPREILAGTQVIISSYRGNVGNFANLLNAYGYWEDKLGFGGSLINESGMVWNAPFDILNLTPGSSGGTITITPAGPVGIMPAIQSLTLGAGQFGGPMKFMGYSYSVDLSGLPVPPAYYRLGGVSISVLDAVSEICQDGGHDYICYLEKDVIKFKTVSRVRQPDPGQIANFINSRDDVASKSIGLELRNDITNAILLGGDITQLIQEYNTDGGQTIWPFWGFDFQGNVIMGQGPPEGQHLMNLNASPIADIMGSLVYPSDIVEMRCALIDFDSWSAYVLKWWPDKAAVINLVSAIDTTNDLQELFPDTLFQRDLIAADDEAVWEFGRMNEADYWTQRAQRVYEFIQQYASEYFGKKFLVRIPFNIYWKYEPETTHRISSDEPCDAGYQPEGTMPLGLQFLNENTFLSTDGRFQCFVKVTGATLADVSKLDPNVCVLQGSDIYVRASVDQEIGIVYPPGSIYPYCVVTLDNAVYSLANDPLGNVSEIASLLEVTVDSIMSAVSLRHGSFPWKIHPAPFRPDGIALPMKSNRDSYGPWFTSGGVNGKVSFERDEGLVPWNYGGFDVMNQAAMAKLSNAATAMQYTETGNVEVAGTPDYSLGDELVAGGPQLTGIDVNISTSGVTTTYRMQTFTPRFGQFTKENADRLRRLGMAAQDMRRAVRSLFQRQAANNRTLATAFEGFMANTSRAVRQATPHDCLLATMTWDKNYGYRTQASSQTCPEAVANARGDNPDIWPMMAAMGLEGLLRPFSTNRDREPDDPLADVPHYETVDITSLPVTRAELDPFSDYCDVDILTWGDEYPGSMHTLKKDADRDNTRAIGLRGPVIVIGWGFSYTGKPVPNMNTTDPNTGELLGEQDWSDQFLSHHRAHPESWRTGPVGLYWDNWRKMWTIPTFLFGTLDEDIPTGGSGLMTIDFIPTPPTDPVTKLPKNSDKVNVHDYLGGSYTKGQKICAGYHQQKNEWYIVSAGC